MYMTAKGSIVHEVIPLFIENINIFVRKQFPHGQYVEMLDGHASRKSCTMVGKS